MASRRPADVTDSVSPHDIEHNRIYGYLSYLGPLFLVGLFAVPNSKFARFHANQGLVLLLATIGYVILTVLLTLLCSFLIRIFAATLIVPILLGIVLRIVRFGVILPILGMALGLWNVYHGRAKELPVIGSIRLLS